MVVVDDEHGGREWNIHAALNIERARVAARRQLYHTVFSFSFLFYHNFYNGASRRHFEPTPRLVYDPCWPTHEATASHYNVWQLTV